MADLDGRLQAALADRYVLQQELGRGGMATVYLATDLKHSRRLAVKVLHPELTASVGTQRFLREIQLAAQLNHPHILGLIASGSVPEGDPAGRPYYVMPYVEGESLRDRIEREDQLPLGDSLQITREVADALAYAHARGVIHRDIKPENILLSGGHALVADFGIARALDVAGGDKLTETGLAIGTPAYMSPEQGAGGTKVDGRSDQYSLACVLYELLVGAPPFTGPTAQAVLSRHVVDPVPPLRTVRQTIPRGVERVVLRALCKVPADRYPTVAEFADALAAAALEPAASPERPRRGIKITLSAAAIVSLLLAVLLGFDVGNWRQRLLGGGAGRIRSLAVLPLENLSGDPQQEYFADGMTDQLITSLAEIGALRVISRLSVMRYKGSKQTTPEIARALRVDAVVAGTVQRVGDRVRIAAQLIPAGSDQAVWARSYDGDLRDILGLEGEVARSVADQIQIEMTPLEQTRLAVVRRVDPQAYDLYLKGRYYWYKRTRADIERSLDYFQRAIEKDSTYAQAYEGLADAYFLLGATAYNKLPPRDAMPKATAAAAKALELDSTLAEAHTLVGYIRFLYDRDRVHAEREMKRAIELNPNYAQSHQYYAFFLAAVGRFDEAVREAERGREVDPLSLVGNTNVGYVLHFARRYDEAIEQCRRALELDSMFLRARWTLGLAYEQKRMFDAAIGEFRRARTLSNDGPAQMAALGHAYAISGRRSEAEQVLEEMKALSTRRFVPADQVAIIYLGLGDKDRALELLNQADEERGNWVMNMWMDPRFDVLRSDPRYRDLLRRLGWP
jgi:eukaryotic-like serine/threonine-protein kinase